MWLWVIELPCCSKVLMSPPPMGCYGNPYPWQYSSTSHIVSTRSFVPAKLIISLSMMAIIGWLPVTLHHNHTCHPLFLLHLSFKKIYDHTYQSLSTVSIHRRIPRLPGPKNAGAPIARIPAEVVAVFAWRPAGPAPGVVIITWLTRLVDDFDGEALF